jgi:hypothetical protein
MVEVTSYLKSDNKMNIMRNITFLICLFFFSNQVFSQQKKDTVSGSPQFLFPQFTDGTVMMKDGTVAHVKLNYDAVWDQMQFLGDNKAIMTIANPENVIKVEIAKRTFVFMMNYFAEEIVVGPVSLYVRIHQLRIVKKASGYGGTSSASSVQSVNSFTGGDKTNGALTNNDDVSYTKDITYYLSIKGKTKVISSLNNLVKSFPSQKDLVQKELNKEDPQFSSIESIKKIIVWINANGIEK